jgi:adenosylcobinamide kinase / adenosylcobinamide-phosphate guanylyltransferase
MRTLVLGGIRSGKSDWAEEAIAEQTGPGGLVRYLATGPGADTDDDWARRVAAHRSRRPASWQTVESTDIATQLQTNPGTAALVDDIGGWLTAAMDRTGAFADNPDPAHLTALTAELVGAVGTFGAPLILVSPEVGLTVVPATTAGRRFADALGTLNQHLARVCDVVVLVVAGVAVPIKSQGAQ